MTHDNGFVFLFDLKPRQKTDPFKGLKFDHLHVFSLKIGRVGRPYDIDWIWRFLFPFADLASFYVESYGLLVHSPKQFANMKPRKPTYLLFQSGILSRLMLANWRCFIMLSILGP